MTVELGQRVTIAGARMRMPFTGYQGIVHSVIYGTTKDDIVLEQCGHYHRTMRAAMDCSHSMLLRRKRRNAR